MRRGNILVNSDNPKLPSKLSGVALSLTIILTIFLTNLVSAQFGFGYGGSFSIANLFNSLDPSTVVYGLLFFIFFTVILMILSNVKLFKSKKGPWGIEETNSVAAAAVSFAISALIVYYMYRSGYNIESFFYELGFSVNFFSFILSVLAVLVAIFLIMRFKFPGFLIVSGLFVMFVSVFTNLIYERTAGLLIGVALVIIGIISWKATRKWWRKNVERI